MGLHQTKKFLHSDKNNQWKQPMEWETIFVYHMSDKGISGWYKKHRTPVNQ